MRRTSAATLVGQLRVGLDRHLPDWRHHIDELGQVAQVRARLQGWRPSDSDAVRALFLAYVSALTDWKRIQAARDSILGILPDWSPAAVSTCSDAELRRIHAWFLERRLGTVLLRRQLSWLRASAVVLARMSRECGSVDLFLTGNLDRDLTSILSAKDSEWKLPGVGLALASEFLKNLGIDDFKPDRHAIRMLGPERLALAASREPSAIRELGVRLARESGLTAAEFDQMVWLYCARGYAGVCGAEPSCGGCPLAKTCRYPGR